MVLKTLDVPGPQRGFGIARRSEKISGEQLAINQETLYPLLLRREQQRAIEPQWRPSENNRPARVYRLTRAGRGAKGAKPLSRSRRKQQFILSLLRRAGDTRRGLLPPVTRIRQFIPIVLQIPVTAATVGLPLIGLTDRR
jgi:DNA-binding PadR family transcriptional regulator